MREEEARPDERSGTVKRVAGEGDRGQKQTAGRWETIILWSKEGKCLLKRIFMYLGLTVTRIPLRVY